MADHGTAIEWTQAPGYKGETWNPVTGCDRVSPGCAHCYALDLAARLKGMGQKRYQRDGDPKTSGPGFGLTLHPDKLGQPLRWTKPRMVFVNSMSDLFHEEIPDEYIAQVFAVMTASPQHIFQVLTKRPERMRDLLRQRSFWFQVELERCWGPIAEPRYPSPNVWLGVTIENRRFVHRADLLRETPAAVRFISAEPLLGPLIYDGHYELRADHSATVRSGRRPRHGCGPDSRIPGWSRSPFSGPELDLTGIDWLITGGESGGGHRRFDPDWAIALRDACRSNGVAFFHKQNGGFSAKSGGRELDGQTFSEFPAILTEVAA